MSWQTDCVGASLECNMIMQPNLGRGIMITLKMDPSIAHAEATIFICFVDGAMLDRGVGLDCLEVA